MMWYNKIKVVSQLNEELKLHIKKLQIRALLSTISIILTFVSISFGFLFLFVSHLVAIILFAIAIVCIVYLIYCTRIAKKESTETVYKPVVFNADKQLSFEKIIAIFENLTGKENQLSISNDTRFFRLNKIFKLRTVIYRTDSFNKKDFDNSKNLMNKKANKELNISQWVTHPDNMMRFNIICTDVLNDELYQFLSKKANHNLTRVEGIINIAIVGNQVIIPPLSTEYGLTTIDRYIGVITFINQVLLNS